MLRSTHFVFAAAVAALLLSSSPALADITFDVNPAVSYQQTTNNPCVIGDRSCNQPAGMSYTVYSGTPLHQGDTYDAYSPTYTYADLVGFLSGKTSFQVGIDENYATGAGAEILAEFTVWVCQTTCTSFAADAFNPPSGSHDSNLTAGGYSVLDTTNTTYTLATHNGNGFSDALSSTIDITGLTTAKFVFEGSIQNDSDGMEQFFLIPTAAVPEPASILMLGASVAGLLLGMRKKRS